MRKLYSKLAKALLAAAALSALFAMASPAAADVHFIHEGGKFNFSLRNNGWFTSPLNEKFFFNLIPDLTLILEDGEKNSLLSVSRLDPKTYGDDLSKAYDKLLADITADTSNIVFLKHDFSYNDIEFKDVMYKDRVDMSNFRVILASDTTRTPASEKAVYMVLFYYPKKSGMAEAEDDVNALLKTFKFGTELPQVASASLIDKGADCIGEFMSLDEQSIGSVLQKAGDKKTPVYKDYLVRLGSVLETRGGKVSFKLNDGGVFFLGPKTRLEFASMAEMKMESGEAFAKLEHDGARTAIRIGNYIRFGASKGEFAISCVPSATANCNVVTVAVRTGECEITGEGGPNPLAKQRIEPGKALVVNINDMGKILSSQVEFAPEKLVKERFPTWTASLVTSKVYESVAELEKMSELRK